VEELIDQATAETANKSIESIINQRTAEAFRKRNETGEQPNIGAIAVQATADYNGNPAEFRRGKIVLGRLTALLQQETGTNPWIWQPTEHLKSERFSNIAAEIWNADA